jgi:hypothetical protein
MSSTGGNIRMAEPPSESLLTRKMEGRDARDGVKGAEVVPSVY